MKGKQMAMWEVNYSATYYVVAENEEQAIQLAIEEHEELPDGTWEPVAVEMENA